MRAKRSIPFIRPDVGGTLKITKTFGKKVGQCPICVVYRVLIKVKNMDTG
jgi:hypothetical protein